MGPGLVELVRTEASHLANCWPPLSYVKESALARPRTIHMDYGRALALLAAPRKGRPSYRQQPSLSAGMYGSPTARHKWRLTCSPRLGTSKAEGWGRGGCAGLPIYWSAEPHRRAVMFVTHT